MLGLVTVAFLVPLLTSAALCYLFIQRAPAWGLTDQPSSRKNHARPVALGGGIAIFAAVAFALLLVLGTAFLARMDDRLAGGMPTIVQTHAAGVRQVAPLLTLLLLTGLAQTLLGFWDDRRGVDYRLRLAVEIGLVLVLVSQGVELAFLPGYRWLTVPLTVMWIVGLTNAFNFLDNMDGLSAGVGWIATLLLAWISWLVGDLFLVGCYGILAGALGGFLYFNRPPARIFMGDAGSNFLGFWIGTLTVISTFQTAEYSHVTLLAPLCVLAVPIYDVVTVSGIRLSQGRSPFHADRQHFSHRLVELGFSRAGAVAIIHLVTLVTGLSGVALYFIDSSAAPLVFAQLFSMMLLLVILDVGTWRQSKQGNDSGDRP
jgi:UDP-GlcNAc:undecaprenyl-phosphate GlcNAc-1-phosphate transferase